MLLWSLIMILFCLIDECEPTRSRLIFTLFPTIAAEVLEADDFDVPLSMYVFSKLFD